MEVSAKKPVILRPSEAVLRLTMAAEEARQVLV
jgi:hypothetical protein